MTLSLALLLLALISKDGCDEFAWANSMEVVTPEDEVVDQQDVIRQLDELSQRLDARERNRQQSPENASRPAATESEGCQYVRSRVGDRVEIKTQGNCKAEYCESMAGQGRGVSPGFSGISVCQVGKGPFSNQAFQAAVSKNALSGLNAFELHFVRNRIHRIEFVCFDEGEVPKGIQSRVLFPKDGSEKLTFQLDCRLNKKAQVAEELKTAVEIARARIHGKTAYRLARQLGKEDQQKVQQWVKQLTSEALFPELQGRVCNTQVGVQGSGKTALPDLLSSDAVSQSKNSPSCTREQFVQEAVKRIRLGRFSDSFEDVCPDERVEEKTGAVLERIYGLEIYHSLGEVYAAMRENRDLPLKDPKQPGKQSSSTHKEVFSSDGKAVFIVDEEIEVERDNEDQFIGIQLNRRLKTDRWGQLSPHDRDIVIAELEEELRPVLESLNSGSKVEVLVSLAGEGVLDGPVKVLVDGRVYYSATYDDGELVK